MHGSTGAAPWAPGPQGGHFEAEGGSGLRLDAPGVPLWVLGEGGQLAFADEERLVVREAGGWRLFPVGPVHQASVTGGSWQLLVDDPTLGLPVALLVLEWSNPPRLRSRPLPSGTRWARLGDRWCLIARGPRIECWDLEEDKEISLPEGARTVRAAPWSCGAGLCWADGRTVYRLGSQGGPRVAGTLRAAPLDLEVGPAGAAIFKGPKGVEGLAPSAGPRLLEGAETVVGARFSPDGCQVLLSHPKEVAVHDLRTGAVVARGPAGRPVGFLPQPAVLVEESGALTLLDGDRLMGGFHSGGPAAIPGWTGQGDPELPPVVGSVLGEAALEAAGRLWVWTDRGLLASRPLP